MFQLTTSRRGRPLYSQYNPIAIYVSTHDLTKRSTSGWTSCQNFRRFQLTTSRRGRHGTRGGEGVRTGFQLTTSRRGRHRFLLAALPCVCFNSRPHEEVDLLRASNTPLALTFQLTTSRRGRLFLLCSVMQPV